MGCSAASPTAGITFAGALDAGKAASDLAIVGSVEESALQGTVGSPEAAAATRLSIRTSDAPISLKQG
jgi:hypothetical protein